MHGKSVWLEKYGLTGIFRVRDAPCPKDDKMGRRKSIIGSCGNKKYGIKTITLFFDSGKRTELYKSSRTITYYTANAFQTNGRIGR